MTPAELALFIIPAIAVAGVVGQIALSLGTVKQLKEDVHEIRKDAATGSSLLASINEKAASQAARIDRLERKVWNGDT